MDTLCFVNQKPNLCSSAINQDHRIADPKSRFS